MQLLEISKIDDPSFRIMKNIKVSILFVVLVLASISCSRQKAPIQPNILFIMSDDHAWQAVSAYDHPIGRLAPTPQIDRIAHEGMIFHNMYVANSICGPSRACIITGKFSHVNGFKNNGNQFDGNQWNFAKELKKNGYQTAVVGKWHLKSDPQGFDYWQILPGQGHYYNPDFLTADGPTQVEGYVTDIITDLALSWLDTINPDNPFMLMYLHKAPHREWLPAPEYLDLYHSVAFPEPINLFDNYENMGQAARDAEMLISKHMAITSDNKIHPDIAVEKGFEPFLNWYHNAYHNNLDRMNPEQRERWESVYGKINQEFKDADLSGDELTKWKFQRYMQDYLACIKSVDDNVGRVLDYLDKKGLTDNTIVVYTSDQGFYLGEHGWFDKRFMYEESFRTPMLVRFPERIKAGTSTRLLAQNVDFASTFLDLAGIPIPEEVQGISLVPIFDGDGQTQDWRTSLYYHYYEFPSIHMAKRHVGVRTDRYKLIHFYNDIDEWELYDLENDPYEMKNLYGHPDYEEVQKRMKIELDSLQILYKEDPVEDW